MFESQWLTFDLHEYGDTTIRESESNVDLRGPEIEVGEPYSPRLSICTIFHRLACPFPASAMT